VRVLVEGNEINILIAGRYTGKYFLATLESAFCRPSVISGRNSYFDRLDLTASSDPVGDPRHYIGHLR